MIKRQWHAQWFVTKYFMILTKQSENNFLDKQVLHFTDFMDLVITTQLWVKTKRVSRNT